MFNDLFSQRSDYSTGFHYSGRRKYMNNIGHTVEPPSDFKTKKQMMKTILAAENKKNTSKDNDGKMVNVFDNLRKDKVISKVAKSMVDKRIVIQTYSTTDPSVWKEDVLAGS